MTSWRLLVAIMPLLACGLAGCGDDSRPLATSSSQPAWRLESSEVDRGIAEQNRIADDGVTIREYEQSVDRFRACVERHDLKLFNSGWNPVDHLTFELSFGNTSLPDDEVLGYGNECQKAYVDIIQGTYVRSNKSFMDPALIGPVRSCLVQMQLPINGREDSIDKFLESVGEEKSNLVFDCVESAVRKVFPDRVVTIRRR